MSSNSISQLFKKKAAKLKSELGAVCSDKGPYFDGPGDRYVQLFEHGVILGNMKKLTHRPIASREASSFSGVRFSVSKAANSPASQISAWPARPTITTSRSMPA